MMKKGIRIQIMQTVRFEIGRFTGSVIALLMLGLVATVSIFILKVAFTIAGVNALREGALKAKPNLLEPSMKLEVVTPVAYTGDVIGDLNARHGRIRGMEEQGGVQVVMAEAPLAEMFGYSTRLRSLTQGRASYTMHFSHYTSVSESTRKALTGGSVS